MTVDEAYAYAYQQLRASGAAQTPQRWLSGGEGQLLLARNPTGRVIIPAALPDSLRAALDSPWPNVRIGAVEELRDWLTSDDPARVVTATRELKAVAANDTPLVAATARSALEHTRPPGRTPSPPGPSTIQPGGSAGTHAVNRGVITDDDLTSVVGRPTGMPPAGPEEAYEEEEEPQKSRVGLVLPIGVLIMVALALGGWGLHRMLNQTPTVQTVEVPNVLTYTEEQARDQRTSRSLQVEVKTENADEETKGTIIAQDPVANTEVDVGSTVIITLNEGPKTGTIPDGLVGEHVKDVEAALDDLKFTNVQRSKAKSEGTGTKPGDVISISPEEGSTVPLDSKITVRYATA